MHTDLKRPSQNASSCYRISLPNLYDKKVVCPGPLKANRSVRVREHLQGGPEPSFKWTYNHDKRPYKWVSLGLLDPEINRVIYKPTYNR